ncbi:MAG: hypothetical protein U0575_17480 [Phycisphaerales bacterium]
MIRRATRALALLTLLVFLPLAGSPVHATTEASSAVRGRLPLRGVPVDGNCGCGPYDLGEFDLFDRVGQPLGTMSVFGVPTSPPSVPDDQAVGVFTFVAALFGGTIVGQGQFPLDNGPTVVAISGGTGSYRRARGFARFAPRPNGDVRVVLHLLP